MMAQAHPKQALRPYLAADAALLREIYRASIEQLAADDYSQAQQQAWAPPPMTRPPSARGSAAI